MLIIVYRCNSLFCENKDTKDRIMILKDGEIRKYRSIRGKDFLVTNEHGELKAYTLTPYPPTKEIKHMFKAEKAKEQPEKPLPDSWCGHVFTHEERCNLMSGVRITGTDFISKKNGKKFEASIKWENGKFDVKFPKPDAKKQIHASWVIDNTAGLTAGGDPYYVCSHCGGGGHCHSAEHPDPHPDICPSCKAIMTD